MAKFIRNAGGHIHSVTDEHYESLLEGDGDTDNRYLPHGYSEIGEDEARTERPDLFGVDPAAVKQAPRGKAAE